MAGKAGVRVWDVPTRVFHWALVALFAFSWWSGENGELERHRQSGLLLLALLVFRLIWGVIGGSTARFASFVRGPGAVIGYLKGKAPAAAGHNPLGALSVIALLALMLLQVGTGLFAEDTDGLESGPLAHYASYDQTELLTKIHHISFNLLMVLAGIHVIAIVVYRLKGHNLIKPMITGSDDALDPAAAPLKPAGVPALVVALAVAGGLAYWVSKGAPF